MFNFCVACVTGHMKGAAFLIMDEWADLHEKSRDMLFSKPVQIVCKGWVQEPSRHCVKPLPSKTTTSG